MSPEKRFFLAIVLSFLFSALWMQYIQSKQEKNKPPLPIHTTQQQTVPQKSHKQHNKSQIKVYYLQNQFMNNLYKFKKIKKKKLSLLKQINIECNGVQKERI